MAKMIALKRFTYASRQIEIDDEFEASESDARVLSIVGHARMAEDPQAYDTRVLVARKRGRPRKEKVVS
jgi:hypothetical protein